MRHEILQNKIFTWVIVEDEEISKLTILYFFVAKIGTVQIPYCQNLSW